MDSVDSVEVAEAGYVEDYTPYFVRLQVSPIHPHALSSYLVQSVKVT